MLHRKSKALVKFLQNSWSNSSQHEQAFRPCNLYGIEGSALTLNSMHVMCGLHNLPQAIPRYIPASW